ncbi:MULTISPECIES: hypothetical protein [unclassified Lysobacter]|uniref:hypothetical protein n=1 Tax=unclassified Lysobacter TaxID=2635362 RepID=UPI001BE821A0|nr:MULTISPECIES: hypothetical protein [unclassified Lysobacter]MBT2747019.1 hypothetical protein [Lysobacter sp. ISL-42]MBT2750520.1 hypothetical protein [Lysobacter sp. ISL-50]MBT2776366.1 hypothetical protein [Lysobacter sp. ISL-54]MBT2780861.1 hypothetical protein [Lysobacter sp. ISL-52]
MRSEWKHKRGPGFYSLLSTHSRFQLRFADPPPKATPRGEARHRYEFGGDRYRFVIENRFPGQSDFAEFIRGDYARQP